MSHTYNFSIRDEQGAVRKAMPPMTLAEDSEALAFGARVIAEMINGEGELYIGWTLEITEGERLVASVPVGTAVVAPDKDRQAAPVAESSEFKRAAVTTSSQPRSGAAQVIFSFHCSDYWGPEPMSSSQ